MNVTKDELIRKKRNIRLRPKHREGLRIQYCLKDIRETFVDIGRRLKVSPQIISNVVFGRRRSARIEAEIARLLGKADWNEVVLEARAAVTGKSVKTIQQEIVRQRAERNKTALERLSAAMDADRASKARRAG